MNGISIIDFITMIHGYMNVNITIGNNVFAGKAGQIPTNLFEREILSLEYRPAEKLFNIVAV